MKTKECDVEVNGRHNVDLMGIRCPICGETMKPTAWSNLDNERFEYSMSDDWAVHIPYSNTCFIKNTVFKENRDNHNCQLTCPKCKAMLELKVTDVTRIIKEENYPVTYEQALETNWCLIEKQKNKID